MTRFSVPYLSVLVQLPTSMPPSYSIGINQSLTCIIALYFVLRVRSLYADIFSTHPASKSFGYQIVSCCPEPVATSCSMSHDTYVFLKDSPRYSYSLGLLGLQCSS